MHLLHFNIIDDKASNCENNQDYKSKLKNEETNIR